MKPGFGFADYLLYVDRKAVGAIEAKPEGTLTGVEAQSAKYAAGLPDNLPAHKRPLPFLFESNGSVTYFTNGLDPLPRSRKVFNFPRPETLAECIGQIEQLRGRLRQLPALDEAGLWKVQIQAILNLEKSFARGDPRALVQMATGSGKTFTAVNVAYRLLKFGGAKRILFLVDRGNLGKQTEDEFANFTPADDARKFPELYTVQRLRSSSINPASKVVIPYREELRSRYEAWLKERDAAQAFTTEQREWLDRIAEHIATSLAIEPADFEAGWFGQHGSLGRAQKLFGGNLKPLIEELKYAFGGVSCCLVRSL